MVLGFAAAIIGVAIVHISTWPSPDLADAEQHAVLSDYIESKLTGYSLELGGHVVVTRRRCRKFPHYKDDTPQRRHSREVIREKGKLLVDLPEEFRSVPA